MEKTKSKSSKKLSQQRPVPRRGLSREESAMYIGVGITKFDEMVADGRMPEPRLIDGRKVWDIRALDLGFDELPVEIGDSPSLGRNSWVEV